MIIIYEYGAIDTMNHVKVRRCSRREQYEAEIDAIIQEATPAPVDQPADPQPD